MTDLHAHVWQSGLIEFREPGGPLPEGALGLPHVPRDRIEAAARRGFDGSLIVPGIPEAAGPDERVDALMRFIQRIEGDPTKRDIAALVLNGAAVLVEQGFARRVHARDANGKGVKDPCSPDAARWCAMGAIIVVSRREFGDGAGAETGERLARRVLYREIQRDWCSIADWNDSQPPLKAGGAVVAKMMRQAAARPDPVI